jgi:hypothetical protein
MKLKKLLGIFMLTTIGSFGAEARLVQYIQYSHIENNGIDAANLSGRMFRAQEEAMKACKKTALQNGEICMLDKAHISALDWYHQNGRITQIYGLANAVPTYKVYATQTYSSNKYHDYDSLLNSNGFSIKHVLNLAQEEALRLCKLAGNDFCEFISARYDFQNNLYNGKYRTQGSVTVKGYKLY